MLIQVTPESGLIIKHNMLNTCQINKHILHGLNRWRLDKVFRPRMVTVNRACLLLYLYQFRPNLLALSLLLVPLLAGNSQSSRDCQGHLEYIMPAQPMTLVRHWLSESRPHWSRDRLWLPFRISPLLPSLRRTKVERFPNQARHPR